MCACSSGPSLHRMARNERELHKTIKKTYWIEASPLFRFPRAGEGSFGRGLAHSASSIMTLLIFKVIEPASLGIFSVAFNEISLSYTIAFQRSYHHHRLLETGKVFLSCRRFGRHSLWKCRRLWGTYLGRKGHRWWWKHKCQHHRRGLATRRGISERERVVRCLSRRT